VRAEIQPDLYSLRLSDRTEDGGLNHDEALVASRALRLAQRLARRAGGLVGGFYKPVTEEQERVEAVLAGQGLSDVEILR
jgi:hypothetical protein